MASFRAISAWVSPSALSSWTWSICPRDTDQRRPSQLPLSSCAVEPSAGPLGDLLPLDGGELERDHGDQSSAAGDVGHVGRQVHYLQVDAAVREGLE